MGIVFSIFNFTVIIAEPLTAIFAELYSKKYSILIGCFLKIITALLFFFSNHIFYFIIAEIISGIALTFISGCIMAWFVDEYNNRKHKPKQNLYEIFANCKKFKYTALIIGGLFGAFVSDYFSLSFPWIMNASLFFLLFIFIILFFPNSISSNANSFSNSSNNISNNQKTINYNSKLNKSYNKYHLFLKKITYGYKIVFQDKCLSFLILSSFISSFSLASIKLLWIPLIKVNFNTSISFVGFLWVGIAGAGLIGSHLVKPFIQKFNYKLDGIILISFFSTINLFFMILFIKSFWTLIFYFLFELGKPFFSTIKNDLINYQISEKGRVTILSLHSLSIKSGTSLGILAIGYLNDLIGIQKSWFVATGIFFLNCSIYFIVKYHMKQIPHKKLILTS